MEGCYYFSIAGQAFAWTQLVPILFTLCTMIVTMVTHESIFALYGFFLWIPQFIVWTTQYYFQSIRPIPICAQMHSWAFPSNEGFYTGAIIGAFFTYAYFVPSEQSWLSWLLVYIFATLVPFILIYAQYVRWWEILFSMGFGYLSGLAFIVFTFFFLKPKMRYLQYHFPCFLCGYTSEYIKESCHKAPILESLNRVEGYLKDERVHPITQT